ncbi:MAG: DUF89 family protein [Desulfobacteraceae bacterium]|nr:MAG: DUF89 family protein [Desulfobacteraceae bacterium]
MNIFNDCFPCIVRGSLDAARLATDDEILHQKIMKQVMQALIDQEADYPPPMMARHTFKVVRALTGVADPYREIKQKYNRFAMDLFDGLQTMVSDSENPFETAVRLAIAGNIIDFGAKSAVTHDEVHATITDTLSNSIKGDIQAFEDRVGRARNILWLADNAGEIVFDQLLVDILGRDRVTYVVRGGYAMNDATLEDAAQIGILDKLTVIDSGFDLPGTLVERCSPGFRKAYEQADLIISKGQGNYETLSHEDSRIFFLFKVKCPIIARHSGHDFHDAVILNGQNRCGC